MSKWILRSLYLLLVILPLIPILFLYLSGILILGILTLPIRVVMAGFARRQEEELKIQLASQARFIPWAEAYRNLQESGTLIEEYRSKNGPIYLWYTPEDVAKQSPYPCCHQFRQAKEEQHRAFSDWCRSNYTHPTTGSALRIDDWQAPYGEFNHLFAQLENQGRLLCIGPPLRTKRSLLSKPSKILH